MKLLLDTNIFIYREGLASMSNEMKHLNQLINEIDSIELIVHPTIVEELTHHKEENIRNSYLAKLTKYKMIDRSSIPQITSNDRTADGSLSHDYYDRCLLCSVEHDAVDYLVTNDIALRKKARSIAGISNRVLSIIEASDLLSREISPFEPQSLTFTKLPVEKININDDIFSSLKKDYFGFEDWWTRQKGQFAYVTYTESHLIGSIVKIKFEDENEQFPGFKKRLPKGRHLKIQTFKIADPQKSLGERGIELIFKEAIRNNVDDIYLTVFRKHKDLIKLFEMYGFSEYTQKTTKCSDGTEGEEAVLSRKLKPKKTQYPFLHLGEENVDFFVIPIQYHYAKILFPDSIKVYQSTIFDQFGAEAKSNAIRKVYISDSNITRIKVGDIIFFYYTHAQSQTGIHTVGIVTDVYKAKDYTLDSFISNVMRFVVFSKDELLEKYDSNSLVIHFQYFFQLKRSIGLYEAKALNILKDYPQTIGQIGNEAAKKIFISGQAQDYLV